VELRAGRMPGDGWNIDRWLESSKNSAVEQSDAGPAEATIDVAEFAGAEVVVAVRMANAKGRLSAWSNLVTLRIEVPVTAPKFAADSAPDGAEVKWSGFDGNVIVYRGDEKIGESATGKFVDSRAELGKTYEYSIQAVRGAALSERSAAVSVKIEDRFPPAAPTGLTAAAGPGTVELSWARGTEPDLSHYLVLRAADSESEFKNIGRADVPAYTDRDIKPGSRYRYAVKAADFRNNQSNPSVEVEILIP
jgi:fibronectin type 3 domain-containing protein